MLSRLIFQKSTSGRYPFGKIKILLGALLRQSPMQLQLRSSLNGLERVLRLLNGLVQVIQLIGQKLSNDLRILPFTTRIKNNFLPYLCFIDYIFTNCLKPALDHSLLFTPSWVC